MMEAARTSETLVNFYQTTRRYNPEDSHLLEEVWFEDLNWILVNTITNLGILLNVINFLTPWGRVLLEKLIAAQNSPPFMEIGGLQQAAMVPRPEPDEPSPHSPTVFP
jgi:hypothetical protein